MPGAWAAPISPWKRAPRSNPSAASPARRPRAPPSPRGRRRGRLISHFALNYYSLADSDITHGAAALRDLLKLYADWADPAVRKQIESVKSVGTKGITRRSATPGPISFARGLEVSVSFD